MKNRCSQYVPGPVPGFVPSLNPLFSCLFPVFPVCVCTRVCKTTVGKCWNPTGNMGTVGTRRLTDDR